MQFNPERLPDFYSRPYTRGDPRSGWSNSSPLNISTRAPTRGATCTSYACARRLQFLLAPLREGRHQTGGLAEYEEIISTRAPTRGATPPISAPCSWLRYFYSRPYARGDSNFSQNHKLIYMINC